jgi:2-oxoisovalerate ferredoxin oxidoreductase beta subunit
MKVAELIAQLAGSIYVERVAVFDIKTRKAARKAIEKAIRLQVDNKGFALVEVLAECPTHLKMTGPEASDWVRDQMVPAFPLGVFKDESQTRQPRAPLQKPTFDPDQVLGIIEATAQAAKRFCTGFPSSIDPEDISLKLAGAGGDGAQTAAMLITKAAINEGFDATHIPSYGPESRGGTSYADVHVARTEVLSPGSPSPHALVAFNAPSLHKFGPTVRENGVIVYDSSVVEEEPEVRPGVKFYPVPFSEIALSLGKRVVKNVVALGALQAATGLFPEEALLTVLRGALKDKCALIPLNEEAFRWGVKAVREGIVRLSG